MDSTTHLRERSNGFVRLSRNHRSPLPEARRADHVSLEREIAVASGSPIVTAVLETADAILLVLNAERQIVAFNSRAPVEDGADIRGRRPGEAFDCVNARGPGGCGTAAECMTCGALGAILTCQVRQAAVEAECAIRSEEHGGRFLEFNARAVPVSIEGLRFTVLSLRDVSSERRRQVLEQVFFHDVLNTVTGLRNWAALLENPRTDPRRAAERVVRLSRQVEAEIRHHRALLAAENGSFAPEWSTFGARELLEDVRVACAEHPSSRERRIELEAEGPALELRSDRMLVLRILLNAVCNGLEASPPGGAVTIGCDRAEDGGVRYRVHNTGVMPAETQARIFLRSFSTKAARGRGLGTYSMKLFGERCLGGRVGFVSDAQSGTVFHIWLPEAPPEG